MIPIDPEISGLELCIYAKDQKEYRPLPVRKDQNGVVVSCWRLSWLERLRMFLQGRFYLTMLTFNKPLQPIRITIEKPDTDA